MRQAGVLPGAAPLWRRTPSWGLLLTLGLHLLLAASWRIAHPPAPDSAPERVLNLLPLPLPQPQEPAPRREPAPAATQPARSTGGVPPPRPAPESETITAPAETPRSPADPFAEAPAPAIAETPLEAMVGRARRDAVAIDREMRKGKSGVPDEPDTPWGRFVRGLEGAH